MGLYTAVARPLLFRLQPETAHEATMRLLRWTVRGPVRGVVAAALRVRDPRLAVEAFGLRFANPLGLAAGLDKNGVAIDPLAAFGFSHVEIGTLTGQGQPGNPKPRSFRLVADQAVINRMGFNNDGAAAAAERLARRYRARRPACVLGINLGKSKVVDLGQALADYEASVRVLAPLADYLVVNVSSPNTPGLRDLQAEAALRPLLAGVRACVDATARRPLLLKIAPDLSDEGVDAAVEVALETGCDGLIATNTTIGRGGLRTPAAEVAAIGAGGLSGRPLLLRSTAVLARVARRVAGRVPVIGVGGVDSAEAAWDKIVHGASLVQVYTGLVYHGPGLIRRINRGLGTLLERNGVPSLREAVGRAL